jgi:hypothetical protein
VSTGPARRSARPAIARAPAPVDDPGVREPLQRERRVERPAVARAPATVPQPELVRLQRAIGNRGVGRVLQRSPVWKPDNHPDHRLDTFVSELDKAVQQAAVDALDPDGLPDLDGYLTLWKDTALILRAVADNEIDANDSDEVREAAAAKRFGYARYGYAVESLACKRGAIEAALPARCSFRLQDSRGSTRPDIVVRHEVDGELAWFDITSAGSIGHIDLKTGSGWKTRRYVAEITYPVLDATKVGQSKLSIGERVARKNAIKRRIATWENLVKSVRDRFIAIWAQRDGDEQNKLEKQTIVREAGAQVLGFEGSLAPQQAKSLLRVLDIWHRGYGFDEGGTKAEGEELLRSTFGA